MDTYWSVNGDCVRCGRCVKACHDSGRDFLFGGRDLRPGGVYDYVPCHHCTERFSRSAPCQDVCYYGAIKIERW